ncbi:MAG: hypothetical protein H3C40_14300 [Ignavibacterium sp.]|nr:hypothetical protein [Ignavibacterium sp.]
MTDEIGAIFQSAMEEWDVASEKDNIPAYKNAEGLFLLGLQKAGKPLPRIHSFLAMLYYELASCYAQKQERNSAKFASEAVNSATKHADIALQNDNLEFRAQLIKTYIAGDNVLFMNGGVSNLIPQSKDVVGAIFEGFGRAIGTGAAAAQVSMSKSAFKKELEKLLAIYTELDTNYNMPATEFFFFAKKLLGIAEYCSENRLFGTKEIYTLISAIKIDELDFDDVDPEMKPEALKEISRFKTLAEARLMSL